MTARIEIGRLAAKDLGKQVKLGWMRGTLVKVEHYSWTVGARTALTIDESELALYSDTLIEVTGTNNKEQAV